MLKGAQERLANLWQSLPEALPISTVAIAFAAFDTFIRPLTWVAVTLIAVAMAPWLIQYVSSFEFPGGVKISLRDVERLRADAEVVERPEPLDPGTAELLDILGENPDFALAGLRIEIEKRLVEIARLYGKEVQRKSVSLSVLIRQLQDSGVLGGAEVNVLRDLIPILNDAIHARAVTPDVRNLVVKAARPVLAYLDNRIAQLRPAAVVRGVA